jgi:hypothetical protein
MKLSLGLLAAVALLAACAPLDSAESEESDDDVATMSDEAAVEATPADAPLPTFEDEPQQEPQTLVPPEPLLPPLPTDKVDVTAIKVTNAAGKAPVKGEVLKVTLTVKNLGATEGSVALTPAVTSTRFTDFTSVPLGTVKDNLKANETKKVVLDAGPFIQKGAKKYALGRSSYTITSVGLGGKNDTSFSGTTFTIGASRAVFSVVGYDPLYFQKLAYLGDPQAYLRETFTRYTEVFTPKTANSNDGTYAPFKAGFDQMLNIKQMFRVLPGLDLTDTKDAVKNCEQVGSFAQKNLGLTKNWMDDHTPGTDVDHHGFDMMVGLVSEGIGGIACTGESLQYSGLFEYDLSIGRSQMVLAHETGHLSGAPHCDPLQGYMMCAGEKHVRFKEGGSFVFHKVSRDTMKDRWD